MSLKNYLLPSIFLSALLCAIAFTENLIADLQSANIGTATSMYMKADEQPISYAESISGDLYNSMGHHGPAVEMPGRLIVSIFISICRWIFSQSFSLVYN